LNLKLQQYLAAPSLTGEIEAIENPAKNNPIN
jgi:hypothetical protein